MSRGNENSHSCCRRELEKAASAYKTKGKYFICLILQEKALLLSKRTKLNFNDFDMMLCDPCQRGGALGVGNCC